MTETNEGMKRINPLPLIDVEGAPRERGVQYGRKAQAYIERGLEVYRRAYADVGLQWPEVRQVAAQFRERIAGYSAPMLEEIEGIAQGCGSPVEDIVALNARTELLFGRGSADEARLQKTEEGCTGAIALPGATASGGVLHGQNWDWRDECAASTIVLRIRPQRGPAILTMVEAGTLARCGLNSAGIAITGNFLKSQDDAGRSGVPVPLVRRAVLESQTLHDAMQRVLTAPRSHSINIMLSHEGGEAVDFETTPAEVFWVKPADGLLVHSNHFVSAGALAKLVDVGLAVTPDSLYRDSRVQARLARSRGRISPRDFREAFGDTFGSPYAVCRNPSGGGAGQPAVSTVATIIMDLTARKVWIAPTPYAAGSRYWEYDFESSAPRQRDPQ